MVVLWHAKGVANEVYEATVSKMTFHTEIKPIQVEFDINEQILVEPGSGSVNYSYFSHQMIPSERPPNTDIYAKASGTSAPSVNGTAGRNLQLCDADLSITDQFANSLANTFDLRMSATISPVMVTVTGPPGVPPPMPLPVGLIFQFWFHYDPEQQVNEGYAKPTTLPETVYSALMPPPAGTPISLITYQIDYTLTTKHLELKYAPVAQDMRSTVDSFTGLRGVTPNLAKDDSSGVWYVHANNQVQALVEGQDCTSSFILWRRARVWEAPLGTGDSISGGYTAAAGVPSKPQWVDDNVDKNPLYFIDIPGLPSLPADASSWPRTRSLFEFVSSVDKFPEFGFLYYVVVFDKAPGSWRIRMYDAKKITINDWCAYKSSSAPQSTEDSSQPISDTGWRNVQGTPLG